MPAWLPVWLIDFLISLALRFGIPWLLLQFPWLPKNLQAILQELVDKIQGHKQAIQIVRGKMLATAKERIKTECLGPCRS